MVRALCQYQMTKGYEVAVLANNAPGAQEEFAKYGIKLVDDRGIKGYISPFHDVSHFLYLRGIMKKMRVDIVHTQAVKAGIIGRLAARAAGIARVVHSAHGYGFEEKYKNNPLVKKTYLMTEGLLSRMSDFVIVPSRGDFQTAVRHKIALPDKLKVVYNGIHVRTNDLESRVYARRMFRREIGAGDDEIVIGSVARFHQAKGHKYLIDAAAQILRKTDQKVRFVLVGGGPERGLIENWIAGYGLEKYFVLSDHRGDIPSVMQGLDVHVLASLREGFPIVLLEAMDAGNPCIATSVGGIPEAIEHGTTGFIVPPGNSERLAEAMETLIRNRKLMTDMGARGMARVRSAFTVENMGKQIDDIYYSCRAH